MINLAHIEKNSANINNKIVQKYVISFHEENHIPSLS